MEDIAKNYVESPTRKFLITIITEDDKENSLEIQSESNESSPHLLSTCYKPPKSHSRAFSQKKSKVSLKIASFVALSNQRNIGTRSSSENSNDAQYLEAVVKKSQASSKKCRCINFSSACGIF